MKFKLSDNQYKLLKTIDFSELDGNIAFDDGEKTVMISERYIRIFRVIISEEINVNGLSGDQSDVTEYGRKLYDLYDEIYRQCHDA